MKIGLVRRGYSMTGGAETYLRRFAEGAAAAGHECLLFSGEWPCAEWAHELYELGRGLSPLAFATALQAIKPSARCDVLFSLERVFSCDVYRAGDGVHAAWLARRAAFQPRWRRILQALNRKHAAQLELEQTLFGSPGPRQVAQGAGYVIANSRMVKREIVDRFAYPAERIDVVYNGVPVSDVPDTTRAEMRAELGLAADDYVALFAGSGWERKGLRFAIEAMNAAALPKAHLLVAGSGRRNAMPRSACTRFLGPRRDLPRLLAAADVFILPTIYDPFSNACLEALAAGLPVITTRANGFAEIIERGVEGEIVESPDDIEELKTALSAWGTQERRAAIRERLRAKGAEFGIARNVRATLDVFVRVSAELAL